MQFWGSIAARVPATSRVVGCTFNGLLAAVLASFSVWCAGGCASDGAEPDLGRANPRGESATTLRVGTSGDYTPFSIAGADWNGGGSAAPPTGFDPELASAYAADRGLTIEWVRFRWPELLADLAADRFDIAMSGVTVRPDRSLAGRFSVPVCQTGAVLLLDPSLGDADLAADEIDRPEVRIAVNAGGHLERVTRRRFPNATVVAVPDNRAVLELVTSGRADAAASDTQEAPVWAAKVPSLELWGPFTRDQKAYLVRPDRTELAFDLDTWLKAREGDGRLAQLRRAHLRGPQPRLAAGIPALVGGIAERLALMPMVAEAKRRSGGPIEVAEREERVIAAGIRKTEEIAHSQAVPAPDAAAVRALFRAQIEAAKAIQHAVLAGPPTLVDPPDLAAELRPALIRIGDRIAVLIVDLQAGNPKQAREDAEIRAMTSIALAPHGLDDGLVDTIASAIISLSSRRSGPDDAGAP